MRTAKGTHPQHRTSRPSVDPYCVEMHTWTREELLAARGIKPARRRPTSTRRPKAV